MAPRLVSCISRHIESIAIYNANSTHTNTIVMIWTIDRRLIHEEDFFISHRGRPNTHYDIMGYDVICGSLQHNCKHKNMQNGENG